MPEHSSSNLPTLVTERLTLRELLDTDAPEIFLLRSDKSVNQYLDRTPAETVADASRFIQNIKKNELLYWAITLTDNNKLIGTVCLFDILADQNKCEIGYELLPQYQGKGIMTEAIEKIITFAVDSLNVKTIDAFTHGNNQSSTRLLQKFNFEQTDIIDPENSNLIAFRFFT